MVQPMAARCSAPNAVRCVDSAAPAGLAQSQPEIRVLHCSCAAPMPSECVRACVQLLETWRSISSKRRPSASAAVGHRSPAAKAEEPTGAMPYDAIRHEPALAAANAAESVGSVGAAEMMSDLPPLPPDTCQGEPRRIQSAHAAALRCVSQCAAAARRHALQPIGATGRVAMPQRGVASCAGVAASPLVRRTIGRVHASQPLRSAHRRGR